ncbi:MAG: hypothetical protein EWM72_00002 [Nitrospira sp.]|nr:MAG: hypothetical protein EWM72_00002 [Nitrospira sp.]
MDLAKTGKDVGPLRKVQRREDMLVLKPLIDTELVTEGIALDDMELLVELFLEFALPLEG